MKHSGQHVTLALCLLVAALVGAAPPACADGCRQVHAEINLGNGTIAGNFGLVGTVKFVGDSSGTAPATAPAVSSVFSGILTITTRDGVLELRETGMFSSRSGSSAGPVLSSWGDFLSGTGRYADVTSGELFFFGSSVDGTLVLEVSGKLCRD